MRLLIMLFWSMGSGILTKGATDISMSLTKIPKASGGEAKETMAEQAAKQQRIRSKGNHLLHAPLLVMLSPHIHRKANCVYFALEAMRKFHGKQIVECHDAEGCQKWSIAMFTKSWMVPLFDTWSLLDDPARLRTCGFFTSPMELERLEYSVDGPLEEVERAWS